MAKRRHRKEHPSRSQQSCVHHEKVHGLGSQQFRRNVGEDEDAQDASLHACVNEQGAPNAWVANRRSDNIDPWSHAESGATSKCRQREAWRQGLCCRIHKHVTRERMEHLSKEFSNDESNQSIENWLGAEIRNQDRRELGSADQQVVGCSCGMTPYFRQMGTVRVI